MAMENSLYMWFLKIIGNYGKNLYKWRFLAKIIELSLVDFPHFTSQAELLPELDTPIEKVMESLKLIMTGGLE
jgi:hypothetical protein